MKKKYPISVFIIAKNEEDRIPFTLRCVIDWVDEVIVIDSGSTDKTVAVSEQMGARVIFNKWPGYGRQKIFGENCCRNNWLLNLDADEELSDELQDSIRALFDNGEPDCSAYRMYWRLLLRIEDPIPPPLLAPGKYYVRLYNKKKASFRDSTVHDSVVVESGKTGTLKGIYYHRSFKHLDQWVEKINFYSTMQAKDLFEKGRNPSTMRILIIPFYAFFKAYILRRHFIYGIDGFISSYIYAYSRLIRLAKTRELFYKSKISSKGD